MADVDQAIPYRSKNFPVIPGGESAYVRGQLDDIQTSIKSIIAVLTLLEARLVVLEP